MKKPTSLVLCVLLVGFLFTQPYKKLPNLCTTENTMNLTSLMIPFDQFNINTTLYCSDLTFHDRYQLEFLQLSRFPLNQLFHQPSIQSSAHPSSQHQLPYFYSLWKTSAHLPRLMTPCEHRLYINLLKRFDEVCRQYGIEYMITSGTLLGSYRNHDILPYDDDADIIVNIKYYSQMKTISQLNNDTDWQLYVNTPTNMKFYFRKSPSAGGYTWKWPFIGVDFFTENSTHIRSGKYFEKKFIFPLMLHPIASLWLPGPRFVRKRLEAEAKYFYSSLSIDESCYIQGYSHKEENTIRKKKVVRCVDLNDAYPFIRRRCDANACYETLVVHTNVELYVLKMEKD